MKKFLKISYAVMLTAIFFIIHSPTAFAETFYNNFFKDFKKIVKQVKKNKKIS